MAGGEGGQTRQGICLHLAQLKKQWRRDLCCGGAVVEVEESALPICQQTSVNYLCKLGPKE